MGALGHFGFDGLFFRVLQTTFSSQRSMRLTLWLLFGLAVLVWTPILVLSAMLIGKKVVGYIDVYSGWALWVFLGLMALIF